MNPRYRDGALALGVGAALVTLAAATGSLGVLSNSSALVAGGGGALALELLLARFPHRSATLWADPRVRLAGVALVVAAGVAAVLVAPWLLAALLGGLFAYLLLLSLVLAGVVPGAESWFDREG